MNHDARYSKKFVMIRELSEEELKNLYQYVDPEDVDLYNTLEWRIYGEDAGGEWLYNVRFTRWYNLSFATQMLIPLLLPLK